MGKGLGERIFATVASMGISFVTGFALKKVWTLSTGAEPPDPEDPAVPTRQAVGWFVASGVLVGLAQLFFTRFWNRRQRAELSSESAND